MLFHILLLQDSVEDDGSEDDDLDDGSSSHSDSSEDGEDHRIDGTYLTFEFGGLEMWVLNTNSSHFMKRCDLT